MSNFETMTKDRPIIFTAESVRAILAGTKTQTRRVIKPQPYQLCADRPSIVTGYYLGNVLWRFEDIEGRRSNDELRCPHGVPGDRLWVRETWNGNREVGLAYKATNSELNGAPWRSPLFMPRWASRITLEVTEVRVERVQDISEEDAVAEGCESTDPRRDLVGPPYGYARTRFAHLWNILNAKRGYSWESNPWVWVISFK